MNGAVTKKTTKDKKPLYILLIFFIVFGGFIYFITKPSLENEAIEKIQMCQNIEEVKSVYEQYKLDLMERNEDGSRVVVPEFQDAVRKKLNTFNLTDEKVKECLIWIPASNNSLNIIVIPDLSRRIIDTLNNPNQVSNDIFILKTVWKTFEGISKFKENTNDRLIVDVTDVDQAKGQFRKIANQLQFDLSSHQNKSNRLYFSKEKEKQFNEAIAHLYQSACLKPLGADYLFYFKRYLMNHIKKPTLFDHYKNKVIIITDGYLESQDRIPDTKIVSSKYDYRPILYRAAQNGNILEVIQSNQWNIPVIKGLDLSETEILICEVNERRIGKTKDFEILKTYWEDWLERMNSHKVAFIQREQASDLTKSRIQNFLLDK